MEVGLTGALGAVGDAPVPSVVAAVLMFRTMSFALPLPLGAAGLALWTARRVPDRPAPATQPTR